MNFSISHFAPFRKIANWVLLYLSTIALIQAAGRISAGDGFAAAITGNSSLVTWGKNDAFQLGYSPGTTIAGLPQSISVSTGSSGWAKVSVGNNFTLALGTDGILYSWGSNSSGQLGNGSSITASGTPMPVALPAGAVVNDFSAGFGHALALVDMPGEKGVVLAWGANSFGQLGQGVGIRDNRSTPVRVSLIGVNSSKGVRAVATTDNSSLAIAADGSLWTWGSNSRGELGLGKKITSTNLYSGKPAQVSKAKTWTVVAGGAKHVLAIQAGKLHAWGDNTFGQCARSVSSSPVVLAPTAVTLPKLTRKTSPVITKLAAGDFHSFALATTGSVYAWGFNLRGELGRTPVTNGNNKITTPFLVDQPDSASSDPKKRIPLPAISEIAAGGDFSLFYTQGGILLSYGANNHGQLGLGFQSTNSNATGSSNQTLVGQPNLAVSAPNPVSGTIVEGVPHFGTTTSLEPISLVVRNSGSVATVGYYRVSLFISMDNKLDTTDRLLSQKDESTPLAPAATRSTTFSFADLLIPEISPGNYYLLAQVSLLDSTGNPVPDIYVPDNGASCAVALVGPDLTTTDVISLSNNIVEDGNIGFASISFNIINSNIGTVPAGRVVQVEVFLSSDDKLQYPGDTLLKSMDVIVPVGGLIAGARLPVDFGSVSVPPGVDGGNYNLLFILNRNGTIAETGSAANFNHVPVRVATNDLSVTPPVLPSEQLGEGSTVETITATVQNLGEKSYEGSYSVELFISSNSVFNYSAQRLGEAITQLGGLAAKSTRQVIWTNVQLPLSIREKAFFHVRVIPDPTRGDRYPSNNLASTGVALAPASFSFVDFIFPNSTSIEPGASLGTATYKIINNGPGALQAGYPVPVEVYLSDDTILDKKSDLLIDQYVFSAGLTPGSAVILPTTDRSLNIPSGVANGFYNLIFVFNGEGGQSLIPSVTKSIRINIGAIDLKISTPVLSSLALGTATVIPAVSTIAENLGGFRVLGGMTIELYLSADDKFDNSDTFLATQALTEPLAAGGNRAVNFADVTVPDIGQGNYFLVSRLVLPAGLVDINISNNVSFTPVSVSRPNLVLEGINTPPALDLDSENPVIKDVSFSIVNISPATVLPGTPLDYELYLSRDSEFDKNDRLIQSGISYTGGLTSSVNLTGCRHDVSPFNITLSRDLVGGSYKLLVVLNREGKAVLDSVGPIVAVRDIILQKVNAPGNAMDYGLVSFSSDSLSTNWRAVEDPRAYGRLAFQSPTLNAGQQAKIEYILSGPTELRVPWKLLAGNGDSVQLSVDGNPINALNSLDSVYRLSGPGQSPVQIPTGQHVVGYTYNQIGLVSSNFTRVDLDIPAFVTNGDGDWFGVGSVDAKVNKNYARSPVLVKGQQASLEVEVEGPAQVSFWWRSVGEDKLDTLGFYIEGELAHFPTTSFAEDKRPAVISSQTAWRRVAFLIPAGRNKLRWVYTQGSERPDAQGNLDGLVVSNPVPTMNEPNRLTDPEAFSEVPASTVDLAISSATAPIGTYLLDDAQGTGRLPVRVSFRNQGIPFNSSPIWNASNLQIRLSTDTIWGNSDDLILGNYAHFNVLQVADEITFDVEVNLSFDIPDGNYYLLARVRGFGAKDDDGGEFTVANNSVILGGGGSNDRYTIRRAPDLVAQQRKGLEANYPYHPEDPVYIEYQLSNTGLGDVTPEKPFSVNISLMGKPKDESDLTAGFIVRSYPNRDFSSFLPALRASYPDLSSLTVYQFLDLPSERDMLVAVGLINANVPEDDARVAAIREKLRDYNFYFRILVDTDNAIAESSETNAFYNGSIFNIVPVSFNKEYGYVENAGSFFGDAAFGDFLNQRSLIFTNSVFDLGAVPPIADTFTDYIWDYALYQPASGSPNLLYQQGQQSGLISLDIPPYGKDTVFQTLTFDFNVLATDVSLVVEAFDDNTGSWETLFTLAPPYNGLGKRSLTGYGGLSSTPFVIALDGNFTPVQKVHAARITFRDRLPVKSRGNNAQMRLRVIPALGIFVPTAPVGLTADFAETTVVLSWEGSLPVGEYGIQGSYVVERARSSGQFMSIGSISASKTNNGKQIYTFTDTAPGKSGLNTYRIRGFNSAGASANSEVSVALP